MNPRSFEQQLERINPPAPDGAARVRAKRAAMAEFRRLHPVEEPKPAASQWWKSPWLGGFATACVMVVGVSLAWFVPEQERQLHSPKPAVGAVIPAPAPVPQPATQTQAPVAAVAAQAKARTPVPSRDTSPAVPRAQMVPPGPLLAQQRTVMESAERGKLAAASAASSADDELSEVMTTGTRIQTPGATSANPIDSISAEDMRRLGIVNVADSLLTLVPQNQSTWTDFAVGDTRAGTNPAQESADRSQYYVGNTIANLRGLDPAFGTRTLTLVDGRRVVSTSNQADVVDLNVIPSNLLQRMDVVTGGASATYGSSAAAGVVNLAMINPALNNPPATIAVAPPAPTGRFEEFEVNPVKRVADEPESTLSIDVDTASYSFARRILNQGRLPEANAIRAEEMINYFDYAWPAPASRQEPLRSTVTVSNSPWGAGKKLVHIGIKGYELPARGKPDSNIVFLLDVSGSMNPPDRLPLAIQSMKLLLDSLKPTDTVGIVVYAGAAGEVLPPTPVRNRAVIERALDSLHAGGSTAGAQGIQLAYQLAEQNFRKEGVNRIFLTTDGDFNVGITSRNDLKALVERERSKDIYLSVLTFGQGNTRDDVAQTLAQNGNGVAAYIDTLQEARKVLVEEASAALFTIAGDVKIQVEFNPATVAEYRLVGYETRALKREDFNNDKVDAGEVGSGHRVTAIYEITPVGSAAQLVDPRRYADNTNAAGKSQGKGNEYGFVKIRYKLPGEKESRLMQQPIRQDAGVPAALRQDVAFSTAVAGFAQLLRGGRYTGPLTWDDVIRQADDARGDDRYGYRAEFVQLARKARDVRSPMCDVIQNLDSRIVTQNQQVSQLLTLYAEQSPEVLAAKARVANTVATRANEAARAASMGVSCRANGRE